MESLTLTSVDGLAVGHARDVAAATGCTVVLCPAGTRCAVDQRGGAPGTRETDVLRAGRLVECVDAILLTGGSAFGLAAADGVMRFLEERGRGFPTSAGPVPIVPAAVLYDLAVGSASVRPDRTMGYGACEDAGTGPVEQGSVGAGTGCRVGGVRGNAYATKGGVGSAAQEVGDDLVVGALFCVNALGDVVDGRGEIIAGLRREAEGAAFFDTTKWLLETPCPAVETLGNTVIGVLATNARLSRDLLQQVAAMAHDGLARAIRPAHTQYDGDTIFALSAGEVRADATVVGAVAAEVSARAIRNAVVQARTLGGVPAVRDLA